MPLLLLLATQPVWPDTIEAALSMPGRLPADLERDKRSRPEAILPLLNLDPGDRVVDIFGSGGYYSELIAAVVGEHGEVLLHNNRGFQAWGTNILQDRFSDRSIPNLVQHTREIADLDLGANRLDAALLVMAYHDLYVIPSRYNGEKYVPTGQPADVGHFMEQLHRALKPGARFVVIDHAAGKTTSPAHALELHRIHESFARSEIERYGFHFLRASKALRNPADDHSMIVFDSDIKGNTDRFVLVFEKPVDEN
jgi:predicted methyltransferase